MSKAIPFRLAVYKTVQGQDIDARIYLPRDRPSHNETRYPIIINIHGGAFMLGSAGMVNQDQIQDCLDRGWIVVVPNHRLCPQVDLLEGPVQDCRDLLTWIQEGKLERFLAKESQGLYLVNIDIVFAFGTSSGGHLALCLGFGVPRPVTAIYDMYGPCYFSDPFWTKELHHIKSKLPPDLTTEFLNQVYNEKPIPIHSGISLEGQAPGPPDFTNPREAFALTQIAGGHVMDTVFPCGDWDKVDPSRNITSSFPPTFIVHGQSDSMVPIELSRGLYLTLQEHGVQSMMQEIPNEEHTFAAKMQKGSPTWKLQRKGFDFLEQFIQKD